MKKNVFMRAALLLLVLTLITSCFVGGTFAKYITTGGKDVETARVAKWGVTIDVSGDDAFSTTYAADDTVTPGTDNTVVSSTTEELVAPGTEGTLFTMDVEGKPEVDSKITITANLELNGWVLADSTVYCPIVFNVNDTDYAWDAETYASIDEFEAVVENAITQQAGYYEANADLSTVLDDEITWSWAFVGNDTNDTYLGDQAAAGNAATISLEMAITIEQVD